MPILDAYKRQRRCLSNGLKAIILVALESRNSQTMVGFKPLLKIDLQVIRTRVRNKAAPTFNIYIKTEVVYYQTKCAVFEVVYVFKQI